MKQKNTRSTGYTSPADTCKQDPADTRDPVDTCEVDPRIRATGYLQAGPRIHATLRKHATRGYLQAGPKRIYVPSADTSLADSLSTWLSPGRLVGGPCQGASVSPERFGSSLGGSGRALEGFGQEACGRSGGGSSVGFG